LGLKALTGDMLDRLTHDAARNARLRVNLNLHDNFQDPCQRLFNAIEPGSYIRPHRHSTPPRPETFLAVRGRLAVILFTPAGKLSEVIEISPGSTQVGVEIAVGEWHSILSLETGSIVFETKPGPYEPISDKDSAAWSPEENSPDAAAYLVDLEHRVGMTLARS